MVAQNGRTMFAMIFRRKHEALKSNLSYYIDKVKELTDIEIKDLTDLDKLEKEITRQVDKFNERNVKPETNAKKSKFIDMVHGVFGIVSMSYNPDMTLYEFARLKKSADEIIKRNNGRDKRDN
jgi:hypothetical protein